MIQKWIPDDNPHQARRVGKTGEEVNELGAVLFRIGIQGIDAIDPASGKTNRQRMLEEMADVTAQIELNLEHFGWNADVGSAFDTRVQDKKQQMGQWEAHFQTAVKPPEIICPACKGSGEGTMRTWGHGPDDYEVPCECSRCGGSGVLPSVSPQQIEALRDAMEGELDGFSCSEEKAKAILQHVLTR